MRVASVSPSRVSPILRLVCIGSAILFALLHSSSRTTMAAEPELLSVDPAGATEGVNVTIVGSGFDPIGVNNQVIFTPLSGTPVITSGRSTVTVDPAKGLQRLIVRIPAGLPAGQTKVQVRNPKTGKVASGVALDIITLTATPAISVSRNATGVVRLVGSPNTDFEAGHTTAVTGSRVRVISTQVVSDQELLVTVAVAEKDMLGPQLLTVTTKRQVAIVSPAFHVIDNAPPPNRNPVVSINGPYSGVASQSIQFSSNGSSDPDGDALVFAWEFGDGLTASTANPQHAYAAAGQYTATLTVSDGRGGSATATTPVTVSTPVTLTSLVVNPPALRFSALDVTTPLQVTGHYSNGSEQNLTSPTTGTTYLTSADTVAGADSEGVVRSRANGTASITVTNGSVSATVPVVVEVGVTLQELELTPPLVTLRELGAVAPLTLRGRFSDGSLRDLTSDPGTAYTIDDGAVASVSAAGVLRSVAPGTTTVAATNTGQSAASQVRVILTDGSGFVRGEAYDDTRGLPLSGVTATLLVAGGTPVPVPNVVNADDRGRFTVASAAGDTVIRVERSGFTAVERRLALASGAVATVLDSRLTPLDGRINALQSVFGGEARNTDGSATLTIPPGSLDADAVMRVTTISQQGLHGMLPPGWSPIAAVDLQPAGRSFSQPATLRVPHVDTLTAGAAVAVAIYNAAEHRWIVHADSQVSGDRRTLAAAINVTGQFAFVVPDEAPLPPPPAIAGQALGGVSSAPIPDTATATGSVVPRSAPPGEGARAVGTVILQTATPLSSGAVLRAHVSEQFDLLDSSRLQPLPFVQDAVLYARPRVGDAGTLAARLPITPSLQFTIQQLALGTVRLDVLAAEASSSGAIIGGLGGSVADAAGNVLELPAGLLTRDIAIGLLPLSAGQLSEAVPAGFTLLGAVFVDLVGITFDQPAALSIPRPSGLDDASQIVVAQVIADTNGGRRLKIIGLGALSSSRVSVQTTLGALTFDGVRSGGEFVFLQPAQPIGFVAGIVNGLSSTPQPQVLVTADTAPFASLTNLLGNYVVAGRTGVATAVTALDAAGAAGSGQTTLTVTNEVAALNLTLAHSAPLVTSTTPAAAAVNVALDTPIVVDFSKAIDPASITAGSVALRAGATAIAATSTLSANRRRLTVTPSTALAGITAYTLSLSADVRDSAGTALTPFTLTFTTLDPSKATELALGVITADLPDEDGLSSIAGRAGATEPNSVVAAINLRTQATVTVRTNADGSFRMLVPAVAGDEVTLTIRDASGRETTIAITQFTSFTGASAIGVSGGTFVGAAGRVGRILPRALTSAGVFAFDAAGDTPVLPAPFVVLDQFALRAGNAAFKQLESLTLTESQGRFAPAVALSSPFGSAASLTVPADFIVSASMRFSATVSDRSGARNTATGAAVVVAATADGTAVETGGGTEFPTVFLSVPRQAVPTQVVHVAAIAPAARVDLDLPITSDPAAGHTVMLGRRIAVNGESKLSFTDSLTRVVSGGVARLQTAGRGLPGATQPGDYAVASGPVALVSGRVSGPAAVVVVEGQPFVFETEGANGAFIVPVLADAPFTLRFLNAATGATLGTANGQATAAGSTLDIGRPLAPAAGTLTVAAQPDAQSAPDIGTPIAFTFSEPIDRGSITGAAIVVTDAAGARVFGRLIVDDQGHTVTFVPTRRWRFGTRYRYGVTTSVVAASGARLAQPFAGEFTTFAPSTIAATPIGSVIGVDAAGALAIAGTSADARTVNVASPTAPQVSATLPQPGGARAVAILQPAVLTDRNGQGHAGRFTAIASGDATTGGRLQIIDVGNPSAPVLLGSAQLTAIPGQTPPANLPAVAGTPRDLAIVGNGRGVVALNEAGVVSVNLGRTIPDSPQAPAQAVESRYPADGAERISGVAALPDRVVAAGDNGLTSLDATTLERRGVLFTGAGLRAVDALAAYAMDLNGDGAFAHDSELFDLAVATGGSDGTLQFFRVPATGDPVLLSAVRIGGDTTGVALSAAERLAYVSNGARGLTVVDLDGPASVQPLDADHDNVDDRILAIVDTPGSGNGLALALERGLAFVADGAAGLSVVQLMPARTRFLTLNRDPVTTFVGEEESILAGRQALLSDDAISVTLDAVVPPGEEVTLLVEELGEDARVLSFGGGATSTRLTNGLNQRTIAIDVAPGAGARPVRLRVQNARGASLATLDFVLAAADAAGVTTLFAAPSPVLLSQAQPSVQLSVGAGLVDGRTTNVTSPSTATRYSSADSRVAVVSPEGLVSAVAGGSTQITVVNGGASIAIDVRVDLPVALTNFIVHQNRQTLTAAGAHTPLQLRARFSDGTAIDGTTGLGTTFESSNPGVVTVDERGIVTAVAEGIATITARNGDAVTRFEIAVEFRTPATVTAIQMMPLPATAPSDDDVVLRATVSGTGSTEGLPVTFIIGGAAPATIAAQVDHAGIATARFTPTSIGTLAAHASIVNPATGAVLTSGSTTLAVVAASGDHEPNSDVASAPSLKTEKRIAGTLADGDRRDVFRTTSKALGQVSAAVALSPQTVPASVTIAFLDASGTEIARVVPTARETTLSQPVQAGPLFVAIESDGRPVEYSLRTTFNQSPLTVSTVAPLSGGPGTVVTIDGTGFSSDPKDTRVMFGGVAGKTIAASTTRIEVAVPTYAVDGAIEVISFARRTTGPAFAVGNAAPRPRPRRLRVDPPVLRFDPVLKTELDITRLTVFADPLSTEAEIAALAATQGGSVVGFNAVINSYLLRFESNTTLAGIHAIKRALKADSRVRIVDLAIPQKTSEVIDARDKLPTHGMAAALSGVWDTIDAIRATPPFCCDRAAFQDVKVAVLDSGFRPEALEEFSFNQPGDVVDLYTWDPATAQILSGSYTDRAGHGTAVTSIIGAINNRPNVADAPLSGVLNGVFRPDEQPYVIDVYDVSMIQGPVPQGPVDPFLLRSFDPYMIADAVTEIASRDIDVVNYSAGHYFDANSQDFFDGKDAWRELLLPLQGRALFVASAGNAGIKADFVLPVALSTELPFVIGVAGVRVGAQADQRADYDEQAFPTVRCDQNSQTVEQGGSNCGDAATLAAPSVIVDAAQVKCQTPPVEGVGCGHRRFPFFGTSAAAPIVSGIAALLQSIRGVGHPPIPPDVLKQILVDTAVDITREFNNTTTSQAGSMIRLDALQAAYMVLPPPASQPVYVANQRTSTATGSQPSVIVGLELDPLTGRRVTQPQPDFEIPLQLNLPGGTFVGKTAHSLVISPTGDYLYVVVTSDSNYGDGVLVVNTANNRPEAFVPFSGARFPQSGNLPPPVKVASSHAPMVLSKDGRLLYIGISTEIKIVNTVERILVHRHTDLPAEYDYQATLGPQATMPSPNALQARLTDISTLVRTGIPVVTGGIEPGTAVRALALSPNGKTLFAAFTTGGGSGNQPGGVVSINVDLYTDTQPAVTGLQSNLATYLAISAESPLTLPSPGAAIGGDEPTSIVVSPNGKYVYVTHGGYNTWTAVFPFELNPALYSEIIGGAGFGLAAATSHTAGLAGIGNTLGAAGNSHIYEELRRDILRISESGLTILSAPGFTGVFNAVADGASTTQARWLFPSTVVTGWNPTAGGSIVDQVRYRDVFASRPFAMAIRPDGKRALTALHQTGNFGVLDIETQALFESTATPNPVFAGLPNDMFQALVGVTPALELDNHLVPDRNGAGGARSPDQRLWFPWQVEYAQSGRFAVATHQGVPITPAETVGGGAISVIYDQPISQNLFELADTEVELSAGGQAFRRPWFSAVPICATNRTDIPSAGCTEQVTDQYFEYQPTGTPTRFEHPRGVTIYPYLHFREPAFGDLTQRNTTVKIRWRDPRVSRFQIEVRDLQNLNSAGVGAQVGFSEFDVPEDDRVIRTMSAPFASLFYPSADLVNGNMYEIVARAFAADGDAFSSTTIALRFEDYGAPIRPSSLRVVPSILPMNFTTATSGHLAATYTPEGTSAAPPENVTATALYVTLSCGDTAVSNAVNQIAGKLGAAAGFGCVEPIVAGGLVTATAPGIGVVQAVRGGLPSNNSVVLIGFEVDSIALEPVPEAFEGDGMLARIAAQLRSAAPPDLQLPLNSPLVMSPLDNGFLDDDGRFLLEKVTFKYINGGTISLNDLMDAIRPLIAAAYERATNGAFAPIGATPTWRNTQALVNLLEGPDEPYLPYNLRYSTSDVTVASPHEYSFFEARIDGHLSGLALVDGTLDLGGFGEGVDGVLVWSLPPLESATLEHDPTIIRRSSNPSPGPTVRLMARTSSTNVTIPKPAGFVTDRRALEQILPYSFDRSAVFFTLDKTFGTDFRFGISGHGHALGGQLTFADFALTFNVPTDEAPEITATFSVADQSIVTLGAREQFAQHLVHQNVVGVTTVTGEVQIQGLGQAQATAEVIVCDCTGPTVVKRLLSPAFVQPGDPVRYAITAVNPTSTALGNAVITDDVLLNGTLIGTSTLNFGGIEQDDAVTQLFTITAPFGGGQLQNTVSAPGFTAVQPPPVTVDFPAGGLLITEMVLNPQQDWNDSGGGNGTPFDNVPGTGAIDANDIWIELSSGTTGTETWQLCLTGATASTVCQFLGAPTSTSQTRLRSGWGAVTLPVVLVEVIDNNGFSRQRLDIAIVDSVFGPATGVNDESLTWSIYGSPDPVLQQFLRRAATINLFVPF